MMIKIISYALKLKDGWRYLIKKKCMKTEISVWWKTQDMNNKYLNKLYAGMLGSHEQRVEQLYIIREHLK